MEPQTKHASTLRPFSIRLLGSRGNDDPYEYHRSLLPASYRTETDDLAPPTPSITWIRKELDIQRLNKLEDWLWVAGRLTPPRPLHYQRVLGRDIFLVEQLDLHLVWTTSRMFLKPIPRFLLEPDFWDTYLLCGQGSPCLQHADLKHAQDAGIQACEREELWKCALGFLFSYAALIRHESDFLIAQEKGLLPREVEWTAWRTFVEELDTEHIYGKINRRFTYGELRLSRLNKLWRLSHIPSLYGYMSHWQRFGDFFHDHLVWLALLAVYISIILSAMQVGLATGSLAEDAAFNLAAYGFTVFAIVIPLIAAGLIVFSFLYIFLYSWISTVRYRKRRLSRIRTTSEGM